MGAGQQPVWSSTAAGAEAAPEASDEQRVAALAKAVIVALTAGNGRSARCDNEGELQQRLDADGVDFDPVDIPAALAQLAVATSRTEMRLNPPVTIHVHRDRSYAAYRVRTEDSHGSATGSEWPRRLVEWPTPGLGRPAHRGRAVDPPGLRLLASAALNQPRPVGNPNSSPQYGGAAGVRAPRLDEVMGTDRGRLR